MPMVMIGNRNHGFNQREPALRGCVDLACIIVAPICFQPLYRAAIPELCPVVPKTETAREL